MTEAPLLLLIRHGETESNRLDRFAGWNDEQLTPEGRRDVAKLASHLRFLGGRLYTSPVRRAVETAEILADRLSVTVHTVHDLHEIEVGEWKGLTEAEVSRKWPEAYRSWRESPDQVEVPRRESLERVRERATTAVDQIGKAELSEDGRPALVVTHLALIRVLWLTAQGRGLSAYHSVAGRYDELHPLLWEGRGRLRPATDEPVRPSELAAGDRLLDDFRRRR